MIQVDQPDRSLKHHSLLGFAERFPVDVVVAAVETAVHDFDE